MNTPAPPRWTVCLPCLLFASCASTERIGANAAFTVWESAAVESSEVHLPTNATSPSGSSVAARTGGGDEVQEFLPEDYPEPFGADLTQAWFDTWPHSHFSRRGTPFVHLFSLEPAFMDRDLFLDYRSVKGIGEDQTEVGVELELALTRRIGLVLELPYVQLEPDGGSSDSGVGDFAIAPRLLLVDSEAFLLSANFEVAVPSGSESKGLGSGEFGLAPSLSAWFDLGHWVQASVQAGTEHGLESGDAGVFYNGALAYSFLTPSLFGGAWNDHDHPGRHFPAGLTSVILELTGRTVLDGLDDGRSTAELLFGLGYNINGNWEARGGYQIPVGEDEDIARAFVISLIRHF